MKNLTAHHKIVKQHRARNRCNEAMFQELQRRIQPILAASQRRWDGMIAELQRCNRKTPEQRFNLIYKMLDYEHEAGLHGKEWLDQHINEMLAGTRHKVLSLT